MQVTILEHVGVGYYKVRIEFDNSYLDARIVALDKLITESQKKYDELTPGLEEKRLIVQQATALLNQYVLTTPPEQYVKDPTTLNRLTADAYSKRADYESAEHNRRIYDLKRVAAEKDKENLKRFSPASVETFAWCLNYTTSLTGSQEAIVIDHHLLRDVKTDQIKNDTGVWLAANTIPPGSKLTHPNATSPFACWFNACMIPAAQRHKGLYRIATLTDVDYESDLCNLTFIGRYDVDRHAIDRLIDDKPILPQFTESDAQQLNYTGAEIYYPPCNSQAFEVGDKVIVELGGGGVPPKVIGFYSNPKKCNEGPWFWVSLSQFNVSGRPRTFNGHWTLEGSIIGRMTTNMERTSTNLTWDSTVEDYSWHGIGGSGFTPSGDQITLRYATHITGDEIVTQGYWEEVPDLPASLVGSGVFTHQWTIDLYIDNEYVATIVNGSATIEWEKTYNSTTGDVSSTTTTTVTVSEKQHAIYSDDNTIKATRHWDTSWVHTLISEQNLITHTSSQSAEYSGSYSRTTTGNLFEIDDIPITGIIDNDNPVVYHKMSLSSGYVIPPSEYWEQETWSMTKETSLLLAGDTPAES